MLKKVVPSVLALLLAGCASEGYKKTVPSVELTRFMKKWYVIAGRLTFLEAGAHNAVEEYSYNAQAGRIDIDFYFNKGSLAGPLKRIPQKAWIENQRTRAHWKVSPMWPLKFDYLVIALAPDYSWCAIGVPDQKYLWIMAERPHISEAELADMVNQVRASGYAVNDLVRVPQEWK